MKTIPVRLLVLLAAIVIGAALVVSIVLSLLNDVSPAAVFGSVLVAAVIALACGDYRRKRAFRVRRSPSTDAGRDPCFAAISPPDWTYTTR